jgi:hypothetical protein
MRPILHLFLITASWFLLASLLGGCATTAPIPPARAPLVSEVREIKAPPVVIKEPCIKATEIVPLPAPATPPRGTPGVNEADIVYGLALDATHFAEIARKQQTQLLTCAKLSEEKKP